MIPAAGTPASWTTLNFRFHTTHACDRRSASSVVTNADICVTFVAAGMEQGDEGPQRQGYESSQHSDFSTVITTRLLEKRRTGPQAPR